jgi:hypothetical protein
LRGEEEETNSGFNLLFAWFNNFLCILDEKEDEEETEQMEGALKHQKAEPHKGIFNNENDGENRGLKLGVNSQPTYLKELLNEKERLKRFLMF